MAFGLTFTAVAVPSFTGLKAGASATAARLAGWTIAAAPKAKAKAKAKTLAVRASLIKDLGITAAATAAAGCLMLPGDAFAFDVLLGARDGSLVFEPKEFSVPASEEISFKNNAGFPHNVVFDEDEVPPGVDASAISMPEDELLNGPGETFSVVLNEKGTYAFYCSPHQGAGMVGRVTVY